MAEINSKEIQKEEAIRRLQALRVHPNVVEDFKAGVLNCSEYQGILYWISEEIKEIAQEVEQRTGGTVFHVVKTMTGIGTHFSFLYVPKYVEDWEAERKEMVKDGYVVAYVHNADCPDLSELGWIVIRPMNGGVIRVA